MSKTRKEYTDEIIAAGDVAELLRLAEGYPCACLGPRDNEPECYCRMNSKQVREAVSLAALKRGKVKYLHGFLTYSQVDAALSRDGM